MTLRAAIGMLSFVGDCDRLWGMNLAELSKKWKENAEAYKTVEIGGGVHDFINDVFSHPELFALKKTPKKTATTQTYIHDTEKGQHGKPDFILYVNKD
ncbi:MAG: hypothetical protein LBI05_07345, partial [Planctomycetaceae bacterium]|nr:hypothetical protein [Planctomycetaceae bacterium]